MEVLRNCSTWEAKGAPPLTMTLTDPPRTALSFLKRIMLKRGAAFFCGTPLEIWLHFLFTPVLNKKLVMKELCILVLTLVKILSKILGTPAKMVGLSMATSSNKRRGLALQYPTAPPLHRKVSSTTLSKM